MKTRKLSVNEVELFLKKRSFCTNVLKTLKSWSIYICNQHKHIRKKELPRLLSVRLADGGRGILLN